MSTYGEKVEEYTARVKKAQELGLEPAEKDVWKLSYYVGRAQKKGADRERTPVEKVKDRLRWQKHSWKGSIKDLLKEAVKIRLGR